RGPARTGSLICPPHLAQCLDSARRFSEASNPRDTKRKRSPKHPSRNRSNNHSQNYSISINHFTRKNMSLSTLCKSDAFPRRLFRVDWPARRPFLRASRIIAIAIAFRAFLHQHETHPALAAVRGFPDIVNAAITKPPAL